MAGGFVFWVHDRAGAIPAFTGSAVRCAVAGMTPVIDLRQLRHPAQAGIGWPGAQWKSRELVRQLAEQAVVGVQAVGDQVLHALDPFQPSVDREQPRLQQPRRCACASFATPRRSPDRSSSSSVTKVTPLGGFRALAPGDQARRARRSAPCGSLPQLRGRAPQARAQRLADAATAAGCWPSVRPSRA